MVEVISKNAIIRLCYGLTSREIQCGCVNDFCTATLISEELIQAYEKFRLKIGIQLNVNSGYRCPAHNKAVGGKPLSQHQVGKAIDISLNTLKDFSREHIEKLAKEAGFSFIKFYKSFVHLDVR